MQNTVTPEQIDYLFSQCKFESAKLGKKTCVVVAILPNGFEICGTGSCVDPNKYDQKIGEEIAKEQIKNKLWELEGYILQRRLYDSTDHERPNS